MTNINSILTTEQFNTQQANSIYREGDSEMLGDVSSAVYGSIEKPEPS